MFILAKASKWLSCCDTESCFQDIKPIIFKELNRILLLKSMEIGWLKCCTIFLKDASYVVNMKIIQNADR